MLLGQEKGVGRTCDGLEVGGRNEPLVLAEHAVVELRDADGPAGEGAAGHSRATQTAYEAREHRTQRSHRAWRAHGAVEKAQATVLRRGDGLIALYKQTDLVHTNTHNSRVNRHRGREVTVTEEAIETARDKHPPRKHSGRRCKYRFF